MSYILGFHEIGAGNIGQVGGKGANLGEMVAAGLPVPPGFCVTAASYLEFLRASKLERPIREQLGGMRPDDREDVKNRSDSIRALLESADIPTSLQEPIAASYRELSGRMGVRDAAVAVRSSATAEDLPGASFAGQQDTYLNVRGEAQLLEHIRRCWGSLWTERAVSYRNKQGFDHARVHLCVVVQAMIESEVAGIMFTANPVSGNRDEMVINASWGLGESIVSGLVDPDTLTVNKRARRVSNYGLGSKELAIHYAAGGGTLEVPTSPELRQARALTDKQALQLVNVGSRIEAHYGAPQDIEWGYSGGRWYVLQARPITTLADEYHRTMFVEIFPDPLSPVFLAVIASLFESMLDFTFRYWGFKPPRDRPAIGVFYNQPYFNHNYIEGAFSPLSPEVREPLVGAITNPFGRHAARAASELSWPYLRMAANTLKFIVRFPRQLPGMLTRYQAQIRALSQVPLEGLADQEIVVRVRKLVFEDASRLLNYDFLMIAVIGRTYGILGKLLEGRFGEQTEELRAKLISGVTGNVTMETNKRIWNLAQIAKATPAVGRVLRENDGREAMPRLAGDPQAQAFVAELDRFLREYGHREIRMDILYPTWGEDPAPVLSFIRGCLDSDEKQSPHAQQARLVAERQVLTEHALQGVERGLLGRILLAPIFRWVLAQTQLHTRERDTMHFELTRLFPPVRRLLLELGRRWQQRSLLSEAGDIFFLTLDEMAELADSPHPVQALVHERRQEFETNQTRPWPLIVRGEQEIYEEAPSTELKVEGGLRGIAGSPGVVAGAARVIRGPADFCRLQRGDILVAPLTNPVWTPLFAIAAGVITEVGGILSHGAIVAREYGIPAVMSVAGATTLLADGQWVTVDGNRGLVGLEGAA